MKYRYRSTLMLLVILFSASVFPTPPASAGSAVDNSLFAELLQKYVHDGQVNYDGFKREEDKLDRYLSTLEAVDPRELSPDQQFAFYVNAYNAWTIKIILSRYPDIDSIKEFGLFNTGPWKKKIARINGNLLSLDNIEHDILRPKFQDPRVHFAINCAAYSCPPLRSEPFVGSRLDAQLEEATREFINNPDRTVLDGNTLYVSKIFKWFAEDFDHNPVAFVLRYAQGSFKEKLQERRSRLEVEYLPYDWSLNNRPQ